MRIATAFVAGEGHEAYVSENMGLEAIRTGAGMVATNPCALKNETGSLLHGRREIVNLRVPLDHRELADIAGMGEPLGDLVGDYAAKNVAPLESCR